MVIECTGQALDAHAENFEATAHVKEDATLRKIIFKVFEFSNFKAQTCKPSSKMWYTIKAASNTATKELTMGKIESKRVICNQGRFAFAHEMLIDTSMVHSLVLKVKYSSSILHRTRIAGSCTVDLFRTEVLEDTMQLYDNAGTVVGNVRVGIMVSKTKFPSLHYAAKPYWLSSANTMHRPYTPLIPVGSEEWSDVDCHTVTYVQGQSAIRVQGNTQCWVASEGEDGWRISNLPKAREAAHRPARKLTLQCLAHDTDAKHASKPMDFRLFQSAGASKSSLTLLPGNAFDSSTESDQGWGVWTLVQEHKGSCGERKVEFLALIHIAGPSVEMRSSKDTALALAICHAMFWACLKHDPSRHYVRELAHRIHHASLTERAPLASAQHGRGFFVQEHSDADAESGSRGYATRWMEMRMKLTRVGKNLHGEESRIMSFLRGESSECCEDLITSTLLVAKEVDWGPGNTFLGLPFL